MLIREVQSCFVFLPIAIFFIVTLRMCVCVCVCMYVCVYVCVCVCVCRLVGLLGEPGLSPELLCEAITALGSFAHGMYSTSIPHKTAYHIYQFSSNSNISN